MQNSSIEKIRKLYFKYTSLLDYLQHPLLLVLRLYWGYQFFMTGKGKLMDLNKVANYFASLNIPMPKLNAAMAGSVECFGGLLLLLGLGSRLITIPLAFTMLVAYATADREALTGIFSKPEDFLSAAPFLFLLTVVIVLAFGPGIFSVDAIINKVTQPKEDELAAASKR